MAMLFILVLSGATLWGILNIVRKYFLDYKNHKIDPWTMIVGTMLTASIIAFIWQFIFYGAPKISNGFWTPFIITAILSIIIQSAGIFAIREKEDISLIGAIQGLTPILVLLTSWLILNEFPTFWGLVGILSIVLGLFLFGWQKNGKTNAPKYLQGLPDGKIRDAAATFCGSWSRLFSSRGAQLAFISAIAGAFALNYSKLTVLASSPATQVGASWMAVSLIVFMIAKITGRWKGFNKKDFYIACSIGVLLGIMEIMFSSAYLFGIVPYVGSLKRFQIIVTTILAVIFLKEECGKAKIAAAAIMFAGIIMTAF